MKAKDIKHFIITWENKHTFPKNLNIKISERIIKLCVIENFQCGKPMFWSTNINYKDKEYKYKNVNTIKI